MVQANQMPTMGTSKNLMQIDFDSLLPARDPHQQVVIPQAYHRRELSTTQRSQGVLRGYLTKTAQQLTKFQRKHFYRRFYELNLEHKQLKIFEKDEGPLQDQAKCTVIDLKSNRLVHVEFNLLTELPSNQETNYGSSVDQETKTVLPENQEPIGLIFADGSLMILWTTSSQDFSEWTQAFKSIIDHPDVKDGAVSATHKTVFLKQKENAFVLKLFQNLLPQPDIGSSNQEDNKVVEGWLCKTIGNLPSDASDEETKPFQKAYCLLDFSKNQFLLCDKTNGALIDKITLAGNVNYVETNLIGTIDENVDHPMAEKGLVKELMSHIPYSFRHPFALFCAKGELHLFWASSIEQATMWKEAFQRLIPRPYKHDLAKYVMRTKHNNFLSTLYLCLRHQNESKPEEETLIRGSLYECQEREGPPRQGTFVKSNYELDLLTQRLQVYSEDSKEVEEIFLIDRVDQVTTYFAPELRPDSHQLSGGRIDPNNLILPSQIAPFALHFKDGNFILFWAQTEQDKKMWVQALRKLAVGGSRQEKRKNVWINWSAENYFQVSLYRCLMPITIFLQPNIQQSCLEGQARVSVAKIEPFQVSLFHESSIKLIQETGLLQITSQENDQVVRNEIQISGRLRSLDVTLSNELIADYMFMFEPGYLPKNQIELPNDSYQYPLSLIFDDGEILLLWLASQQEFTSWVQCLQSMMQPQTDTESKSKHRFIVIGPHNKFTATLYKCLQTHSNSVSNPTTTHSQILKPQRQLQAPRHHQQQHQMEEHKNQQFQNQQYQNQNQSSQQFENQQISQGDEIVQQEADCVTRPGTNHISGWLSRTQGKNITKNDEIYLYRFYTLDIVSGILSEYQDQTKSRQICEYLLHRKIVYVETNISNELRNDYEKIFGKYCMISPPKNFMIPSAKMRAICLHLLDGSLILFWASKRREFDKWLQCFQYLQIPITPGQKIRVQVSAENCFSYSVYKSVKPLQPLAKHSQMALDISGDLSGRCLKTAQKQDGFTTSFIFKRYYHFDSAKKTLEINQFETRKSKKNCHDLRTLSWVDSNLTNHFFKGLKDKRARASNNESNFEFGIVKSYKYPLALCFQDAFLSILWFQSEQEQQQLSVALLAIMSTSINDSYTGQDYIVRILSQNEYITSLYYLLMPVDFQEDSSNQSIVNGKIGFVQYDSVYAKLGMAYEANEEPFFSEKYVHLNTATGILSFHESAYGEFISEIDLRLAVAMTDLNQNQNQFSIRGSNFTWRKESKVLALHNGDACYLFLVPEDQFQKWADAFKKVETPEYRELSMWVDWDSQLPPILQVVQMLSPKIQNIMDQSSSSASSSVGNQAQISGYLFKTAQTWPSQSFYKRHYQVNRRTRELWIRQKEGGEVRERVSFDQLILVDDTLNSELCTSYRQIFRNYVEIKIVLPADYPYPFCLCFENGVIMVLFAQAEQQRQQWVQVLKTFEPAEKVRYQFYQRNESNYFASTLYMCLKPVPPTILQAKQFQRAIVKDEVIEEETNNTLAVKFDPGSLVPALDLYPQQQQDYGNGSENLAAAMVSARGIQEGYLFKTSQQVGGMFQMSAFHKRFYRLNLMTEELKVFDKPEGTLKQTFNLKGYIKTVDDSLSVKALTKDAVIIDQIHFDIPTHRFPFMVCINEEIMVLWAKTQNEKLKWTSAFSSMMLDHGRLQKFQIVKTKKNAGVVEIYHQLKLSPSSGVSGGQVKQVTTQQQVKKSNDNAQEMIQQPSQQPISQQAQAQQVDFQPAQELSNQEEEQQPSAVGKVSQLKKVQKSETSEHSINQVENQSSQEDSKVDVESEEIVVGSSQLKNKANLEKRLENMESDEEQQTNSFSIEQLQSANIPVILKQGSGSKENKLTSKKSQRSKHEKQVKLNHSKEEDASTSQIDQESSEMMISENEPDYQQNGPNQEVLFEKKIQNQNFPVDLQRLAGTQQKTDKPKEAMINDGPRRRFRPISGERNPVGPIKILKIIPHKDSLQPGNNNINGQLFYPGGGVNQTADNIGRSGSVTQLFQYHDSVGGADYDKNISQRDLLAQAIKPIINQTKAQSVDRRRIKVKIKKPLPDSKLPENELMYFNEPRRHLPGQDHRYSVQALEQAKDFEDKVHSQIDHSFIDSLINKRECNRSQLNQWGNVAQDLRSKIQVQQSQIKRNIKKSNQTQRESQQHQSQTVLRVPVKNIVKNIDVISTVNLQEQELQQEVQQEQVIDAPQTDNLTQQQEKPQTSRRTKQANHHKKQSGELSDWDEDSEAEEQINVSKAAKHKRRGSNSIVNVRDRTQGLFNVYTGHNLVPNQQQTNSSQNHQSGATNNLNQFANNRRLQPTDPSPHAQQPFNTEQQIRAEHKVIKEQPNNVPALDLYRRQQSHNNNDDNDDDNGEKQEEDDCLAESYRSVWD